MKFADKFMELEKNLSEVPLIKKDKYDYLFLSTNWSQIPLLKTIPVQLIEHEEVKLVPIHGLFSFILAYLVQEDTLCTIKVEI